MATTSILDASKARESLILRKAPDNGSKGVETTTNTSYQAWNKCSPECDAFNCQIPPRGKLPLTELGYLGHGQEGIVKRVLTVCKKQMALKVIQWCQRPRYLFKIQEEVRLLRSLRHHHIVELQGSYIQGRSYYGLLMTPAAECDLSVYLDRLAEEQRSPIPSVSVNEQRSTLWNAFGCLSSTLAFLHGRNTKHKDVKPRNILVHNGVVYFTDFGIAKEFSDLSGSGSTGATACTRKYAAPEVLEDTGVPHGRPADVFSLGCVFTEILTVLSWKAVDDFVEYVNHEMDLLYQDPSLVQTWLDQLSDDLPQGAKELSKIVKNMMSAHPEHRPKALEVWTTTRCLLTSEGKMCGGCCCLNDKDSETEAVQGVEGIPATCVEKRSGLIPSTAKEFALVPEDLDACVDHPGSSLSDYETVSLEHHGALLPGSIDLTFPGATEDLLEFVGVFDSAWLDLGDSQFAPIPFPMPSVTAPIDRNIDIPDRAEAAHRTLKVTKQRRGKLTEEQRAQASRMRKMGRCLPCRLKHIRCDAQDVCQRCTDNANASPDVDMSFGLGCDRTRLVDLTSHCIPSQITRKYSFALLGRYQDSIVDGWVEREPSDSVQLELTWGHGPNIRISEDCYEFRPKSRSVLQLPVYVTNGSTGIPQRRMRTCAPVAFKNFGATKHAPVASELFTRETNMVSDEFCQVYGRADISSSRVQVLRLVITWFNETDESSSGKESNPLQNALGLLVATYVLESDLIIPIDQHDRCVRQLDTYQPGRYKELVPPSVLNHQLKAVVVLIQQQLMASLLSKLHHILMEPKEFIRIFLCMLVLSMILEDVQQLLFPVDVFGIESFGSDNPSDLETESAQVAIDEKFEFLTKICLLAFGEWRKLLHDEAMLRRIVKAGPSFDLFMNISTLIKDNHSELVERSKLAVSPDDQSMSIFRLTARFLLAIWE